MCCIQNSFYNFKLLLSVQQPLEVFWAPPSWEKPRGRRRTLWRGYISSLASGSPRRSWAGESGLPSDKQQVQPEAAAVPLFLPLPCYWSSLCSAGRCCLTAVQSGRVTTTFPALIKPEGEKQLAGIPMRSSVSSLLFPRFHENRGSRYLQ